MTWIFPTAPFDQEAMQHAWYSPSRLTPFPSSRPELDDPEDEEGLTRAIESVEKLIERAVEKGTPPERIVVGGFSQGCAVSLLLSLTSKWGSKLAGVVGLMGYLPVPDKIGSLRQGNELSIEASNDLPFFLARGMRDILVPKRYWTLCLDQLKRRRVKEEMIEAHEYEGLGHAASGMVLRDLCAWLERVLPAK
jgi:predicted esterase